LGPRTLYGGGDCDGKFKDARLNGRRPLQIQPRTLAAWTPPLQLQRQWRTGNIAYATDGNCDGAPAGLPVPRRQRQRQRGTGKLAYATA